MHFLPFHRSVGAFYFFQIWLIFMLSACSPEFVPPQVPETISPGISAHTFTSFDNTKLPLRVWKPMDEIEGVIIALHGFNDYSNFMKDSALFFNNHQLAVYAYDQRGFGATQSRTRWGSSQALKDDLGTFISIIRATHPDIPVYVLGDSMGGAVTILTFAQDDPPKVEGLILVAPAVWARSEMPFYQRFSLAIAARILPWLKVSGKSLDITPSDNDAMLRELGRDPLIIKESRIDVLYGLSNLMDKAYSNAEKLRNRLLLLYGEKDEIIPREPVVSFYQRLPLRSEGKQRMILYENGYHMLMRDLDADIVLQDIVEWIDDRATRVSSR